MSESDTQLAATQAEPAATEPEPALAPGPARRRVGAGFLVALIVAVVGYLAWQTWIAARAELHAAQEERHGLSARIEALQRTAEQARRDANGVGERLDDATKVNQSLREQLLAFGERARLLEDAVANLADKRLSGHDAMLLNEAEMLLALGAERYRLFHDAEGTIEAYRLADTSLAAVDDPAFAAVRQAVSGEIDALTALKQVNIATTVAALAALREAAPQLPAPPPALAADQAGQSRWAALLGRFIRVRHDVDMTAIVQRHDAALARQLFALDLRDAEAALLARDDSRWQAALADAKSILTGDFAADAEPVRAAQTRLAALAALDLAPPPPENLGAALHELRNLRATHALRQAPAAPAAARGGKDIQ